MILNAAYTIPEFLKTFKIGHSYYYDLHKRGLGPRVTVLPGGRKKIITGDNASAWINTMEELPASKGSEDSP